MEISVQSLGGMLVDEIINAVGLPNTVSTKWIFNQLFHKAAERLAGIGVTFDQLVRSDGFPSACSWALTKWCRDIRARGAEGVPQTGPLLAISNHAGAYDSVVIASMLGRKDVKLIASDVAFLKNLPTASQHFLFISGDNVYARMSAARLGIRHLKDGGALILFGTGLIDPDPAVYTGAEREIENWSSSVDLFLRKVPETNVMVTIVSGIVSSRWAHHPVTWLKRIGWKKRRLAEFGQVLEQLFFPGRLYVSPRVSFSPPMLFAELQHYSPTDFILPAVISRGKALLVEHISWTESLLGE